MESELDIRCIVIPIPETSTNVALQNSGIELDRQLIIAKGFVKELRYSIRFALPFILCRVKHSAPQISGAAHSMLFLRVTKIKTYYWWMISDC